MKNSSSLPSAYSTIAEVSPRKVTAASSALPISFSCRACSIAWPMTPRSFSSCSTACSLPRSRWRRIDGGKFLQMNRPATAEITPRFIRGEGEDRREQFAERVEDFAHHGLRRATARRIGRVAIHAVLRDIDVETAEIDRAELIQRLIDLDGNRRPRKPRGIPR